MSKQVIIPKGSAPPIAPYSPGIKAGNAVYVSGIVALDGQGKIIGAGDVKAQTRAVLDAIKSILEGGRREAFGYHVDVALRPYMSMPMSTSLPPF
jgi:aminoacrylate peracid reductase